MNIHLQSQELAKNAADFLKDFFKIKKIYRAIILGTGWDAALPFSVRKSIPFSAVPGFRNLPGLKGHDRTFNIGKYNGTEILVLRGRIHMNEIPCSQELITMVRLQIELLFHMGVTKLISTSAVGSLRSNFIKPGDLVAVHNFLTLYAPTILYGGEFCSPHHALANGMHTKSLRVGKKIFADSSHRMHSGVHVMVNGPSFETPIDASALAFQGADIAGMSSYPEAQLASLYKKVQLLCLCLVTNVSGDDSSHDNNLKIAGNNLEELQDYLRGLLVKI